MNNREKNLQFNIDRSNNLTRELIFIVKLKSVEFKLKAPFTKQIIKKTKQE